MIRSQLIFFFAAYICNYVLAADPIHHQFSNFKISSKFIEAIKEKRADNQSILKSKNSVESGEQSELFQRILAEIGQTYETIGERQATDILHYNEHFDLGKENFSGFEWQKAMGDIGFSVNRQLAPDLLDDERYIVYDRLTLLINASTFLQRLSDQGDIEINNEQLAAFAGINFKRTYQYTHFAANFNSALTADYSKLFLSFLKFRRSDFSNLKPYEIVQKEDYFSAKTGGLISVPVGAGVSIGAGVLATYNKFSRVILQALGPEDSPGPNEFMRVSIEKEKGIELTGQLRLYLDFYQLLRLTLLSYDISYEYAEEFKTSLSFKNSDIEMLKSEGPLGSELSDLLKLKKTTINTLRPYVTAFEERVKENTSSKYAVLIYGGQRYRNSERIKLIKDDTETYFTKLEARTFTFKENLLSKILGILIKMVFKSDNVLTQYQRSMKKHLLFEFKETKDNATQAQSEQDVSVIINQEFKTRQESLWKNHPDKKRAVEFAKTYTFLSENIISSIENETLKGPISLFTNIRIEMAGLLYFNKTPRQKIFDLIADICEDHGKRIDYCINVLDGKYKAYIIPHLSSGKINATKLKSFLFYVHKYTDKINFWQKMFGQENLFFHGGVQATTKENKIFTSYFHRGEFRGLGVIDKHKRKNGAVVPIPIF